MYRRKRMILHKKAATIYCDFCEKSEHEVRKLISNKTEIHICNECVAVCVNIIDAGSKATT